MNLPVNQLLIHILIVLLESMQLHLDINNALASLSDTIFRIKYVLVDLSTTVSGMNQVELNP